MIYVDYPNFLNKKDGKMYAHMMSDVSQEELHVFASTIKVPKYKYHKAKRLHYDVTASQVETAISNGAVQVTSKQLIEIYKAGKVP